MRHHRTFSVQIRWWLVGLGVVLALATSCGPAGRGLSADGRPIIVVTYSVLASLVGELAGDSFLVVGLVPNGQDPHDWSPSAKDIEMLTRAALVVENGLGLEAGLGKALEQARAAGVPVFTAADHVTVRHVGPGEGIPGGDADQTVGAADPHFWLDPVAMGTVLRSLAEELQKRFTKDLSTQTTRLLEKLDALDKGVRASVDKLPAAKRKLLTGHESLGYFAQRYGFRLIGAIIPSLNSQAETSAAALAKLTDTVRAEKVGAIFTELGTSPKLVEALARATHAKVFELPTHVLPEDNSYFTLVRRLTDLVVIGLR